MRTRIRSVIRDVLSHFMSHLSVYADRSCYFSAVVQSLEEPARGFLSLGQIYEAGSAVISRDLALAYAMYTLSVERQRQKNLASDLAMGLESRLTAKDWVKVNEVLEKFSLM